MSGPMDISDYDFDLPQALIAQHPLAERSASRLLVYDRTDAACRALSFLAMIWAASFSACGWPISGRAWPLVSRPSRISVRSLSGRLSRRSRPMD